MRTKKNHSNGSAEKTVKAIRAASHDLPLPRGTERTAVSVAGAWVRATKQRWKGRRSCINHQSFLTLS